MGFCPSPDLVFDPVRGPLYRCGSVSGWFPAKHLSPSSLLPDGPRKESGPCPHG